jgi:hypothetical protein
MDPIAVTQLFPDILEALMRIGQASGALHDAVNDLAEIIEKLQSDPACASGAASGTSFADAGLPLSLAKLRVALAHILPKPKSPGPTRRGLWYPHVSANVIAVKRQLDGSAIVTIDGKKLAVPPALGDLVSELIVDDGSPSPDDLIPYKRLPDLALKIQQRRGQPLGSRALNQLIYRLRELLDQHDLPRFLVQTNRRIGARLLLRRRLPGEEAVPVNNTDSGPTGPGRV